MFVMPIARTARSTALRPDVLRAVDRLLHDGLQARGQATEEHRAEASRAPALDIVETATAYLVTADLPGVTREDIQLSVEGRRVQLLAEAKAASAAPDAEAARMLYRERAPARYARSFTLPAAVDQAGAQARFDNGVLTLTLPKQAAAQRVQIRVN